ncbi:MAG: 1-cyclohexenylcarbonyl CoA reductase [Planctomycetaceae bacterium]|nr:1-cyclohexenylcarbonyl CoA reductase [Planctomycetaceae bacterium]
MIDLTGKLALVTGGSRGIGRATAVRLAEAGADVVINFVTSQSAAAEVAAEVQRLGRRSATVKADVSEPEDVAAMIDFIGDQFGRLDILVSNAASGGFRTLLDAQPQHLDAAMHTNVLPLITLAQAARGLLVRDQGQDRAKIVALSSHGSRLGLPAYGLIGASKAALESIIRQLAYELGNDGVNCNVVLAGLVATDSTKHLPGAEEMFAAVQKQMLTGERPLTADDVADAVLFLSSPLSDLVQGATLVVDGGVSVRG